MNCSPTALLNWICARVPSFGIFHLLLMIISICTASLVSDMWPMRPICTPRYVTSWFVATPPAVGKMP